jgi:hypothetical protein
LNIGKKPLKPKSKTKIQWLEAAWKIVAHHLRKVYYENKTTYVQFDYEYIQDKIHWTIFAPQVQNNGNN